MGRKKSSSPVPQKSARPGMVTYVKMDAADNELPQMPLVPKKSNKGLKIAGITAAMLLVAAGTVYGGATYYYSNRFFKGTTINGIEASGKTAYEVEQEIAESMSDYEISVSSRNAEPETISGKEIGVEYASQGEVLSLLKKQNPFQWYKGYTEEQSYTVETKVTFDCKLLENRVRSLSCAKEENQVEPQNAYVTYTGESFEIVPETEGSKLKVKTAYKILGDAITSDSESVDLASEPEAYKQAEITSDSESLQQTVEAYNNLANAKITYTFGDATEVLDGTTISTWLSMDGKGELIDDDGSFQQKAAEYVAQLAAKYDTVGTEREFQSTSGRIVYVYGSSYGWQIDQASETAQLIADIRNGGETTREPVYAMTANSRGVNDFGSTYIEVDLGTQYMYYYQYGDIIFSSPIVSGMMRDPDRQTPSGVYTLYYKKSPEILKGNQREDGTYEYETPVTYWMPFNGGIGFHDATWQPYFGGDRCYEGGSHGCINLPYDAAASLYDIIQYGVPIICFY